MKQVLARGLTSLLLILLVMNAGCRVMPETAFPVPTPTVPPPPGNLSADSVTTLESLEQVDDHPLYVMHYRGEYVRDPSIPETPPAAGFSCSLFAALGAENNLLYGRNYDWEPFTPALLLFTDPPDGYASVSVVDIAYLGYDGPGAFGLADRPLAERAGLLRAPFLPFDGMNEHGLTVGMAAVMDSLAGFDPALPTIGSLGIIRQVLDHARTVPEAVAIFAGYNIDFGGGPPIHYLLADAAGDTALVEYIQGEMIVLPGENPWHLATNFLRGATEGNGSCPRYAALASRLEQTGGVLDPAGAMDLLQRVSQPALTQWTVVYHLATGELDIAMGGDHQSILHFKLASQSP